MPILQEGELEFTFPAGTKATRFDGSNHGLSHCMKAVDFVVEFAGFDLFVEVKDPDISHATPQRRAQFAADLTTPAFPQAIARKYSDSFLYRWAEQHSGRPIRYVVLLQLAALQAPEYLAISGAIERELPSTQLPSTWTRSIVGGLAVLSVPSWNRLGAYGTVRRV